MYYYVVYAKSDCPYCVAAINALGNNGLDYVLVLMDKSPDFALTVKKKYEHHTVPIVLRYAKSGEMEEFIGGADDLIKQLRQEGYEC